MYQIWMVKIMENPYFLMDDLGVKPTVFGNIHYFPRNGGFPQQPWVFFLLKMDQHLGWRVEVTTHFKETPIFK